MDPQLILKIVSAIVLLILPFFIAFIPFVLARIKCFDKKKIMIALDIMNAFSGGVLLATGLLHLLGESHEMLTDTITKIIREQRNSTSIAMVSLETLSLAEEEIHVYPFSFLFAGLGMMFIFFLEKSLEAINHCIQDHRNKKKTVVVQESSETKVENVVPQTPPLETTVITEPTKEKHSDEHCHHHVDVESLNSGSRVSMALSGFILWVSLVSHSVFEGLGFGAAQGNQAWDLFIAIIAHHFISAFALGVILNEGVKSWLLSLFYISSFSLSVPLGIVIGIFVSNAENHAWNIVQGICLSLASGAFLFISCFEVLAHFETKRWVIFIIKMFLFCLGFTIMALVAISHA